MTRQEQLDKIITLMDERGDLMVRAENARVYAHCTNQRRPLAAKAQRLADEADALRPIIIQLANDLPEN